MLLLFRNNFYKRAAKAYTEPMKSTQEKIIIVLGLWVFILPFLGFPENWKTGFFVLTGLALMYLGALLLKHSSDRLRTTQAETKTETFTETPEHTI